MRNAQSNNTAVSVLDMPSLCGWAESDSPPKGGHAKQSLVWPPLSSARCRYLWKCYQKEHFSSRVGILPTKIYIRIKCFGFFWENLYDFHESKWSRPDTGLNDRHFTWVLKYVRHTMVWSLGLDIFVFDCLNHGF